MNRTYPKPEPIDAPIYLDSHLWFASVMIFGMLFVMFTLGFVLIDGGKLNDCNNLNAEDHKPVPQNWIDLCNRINGEIVNTFIIFASIVGGSLIMYCISKIKSKQQNYTGVKQ